jgi:hypothetical protein
MRLLLIHEWEETCIDAQNSHIRREMNIKANIKIISSIYILSVLSNFGLSTEAQGKTKSNHSQSTILKQKQGNSILGVYTCENSDAVMQFEADRNFTIREGSGMAKGTYRLQGEIITISLMNLSVTLRFDGHTITDADGKHWTKVEGGLPPVLKPRGQKAESNFFTFELQGCRRSGSIVSCDLLITSNDKDKYFDISEYQTLLHDDLGNEVEPRSIMVAGKTGYNRITLFVSGVATKAALRFEGISPEAARISLLTINCRAPETSNGMGGEQFKIQFRNIPLNR